MRRTAIATGVIALVLAAPAAAGLPRAGELVPGQSLGGVRLGDSPHGVRALLGTFYGVCRGCKRTTWYFTYRPFAKHGLAVEFTDRRVSGIYTLWQPSGWHATNGLKLGATPVEVHKRVGSLPTTSCSGYDALVADEHGNGSRTVYYIYSGHLWGFGLFHTSAQPCR